MRGHTDGFQENWGLTDNQLQICIGQKTRFGMSFTGSHATPLKPMGNPFHWEVSGETVLTRVLESASFRHEYQDWDLTHVITHGSNFLVTEIHLNRRLLGSTTEFKVMLFCEPFLDDLCTQTSTGANVFSFIYRNRERGIMAEMSDFKAIKTNFTVSWCVVSSLLLCAWLIAWHGGSIVVLSFRCRILVILSVAVWGWWAVLNTAALEVRLLMIVSSIVITRSLKSNQFVLMSCIAFSQVLALVMSVSWIITVAWKHIITALVSCSILISVFYSATWVILLSHFHGVVPVWLWATKIFSQSLIATLRDVIEVSLTWLHKFVIDSSVFLQDLFILSVHTGRAAASVSSLVIPGTRGFWKFVSKPC